MKFDYSKTLNEQLPTFEYYKNRYCAYELQIIQLKEQVEYLRRSCDRKEETIIDLQFELTVIDELEKWLKEKLEECNTYSKYIEKKVAELQARSSGKTYIASEIMKNEVTKKNWKEILNKINELKDSDIK